MGLWGLPLALVGGALRVSAPYLFVSLGECLTEKSGRINLGQEGTLIMGAMSGYGVSYLSGSAWLGVLAAGCVGVVLGGFQRPGCAASLALAAVAVGIAMMLLGTSDLAFLLGKPLIQPTAPRSRPSRSAHGASWLPVRPRSRSTCFFF